MPSAAVPRPYLLDELRRGRGRALTLVCAPAGYGKTTLVSQWAAADADAAGFAWLTLDAGDADPARFWTYVVSALSAVVHSAGRRSLPALNRRPGRLITEALPLLLDELEEGSGNVVLVLDDYQLAENAPLDETVAFFTEHRPAGLQVVISARSDPPLPFGRWRANGQLAEIRADQLRFGEREVADFFDRTRNGGLSPAELNQLTARTGQRQHRNRMRPAQAPRQSARFRGVCTSVKEGSWASVTRHNSRGSLSGRLLWGSRSCSRGGRATARA